MFPFTTSIVGHDVEKGEEITLIDIIRDRCRTQEAAGTGIETDKVHQVTSSPEKDARSGQKQERQEGRQDSKGSLEAWAKQYPSVWVVTMKQFDEGEVKGNFKPDDIKRVGMRPKGGVRKHYAVIAYKDADRGGAVVKEVLKKTEGSDRFRAREFVYKKPGNGQGRA
ncbi:hypothetical protein Pmar_PMAR020778 [Perkinsus marinus ATCC 50983]|uniref:Uncharacterized protein n=1 Tax=Perkinsus marinus (strain ATCC 50983 / TXsc) TaxID=423536 RepID=C5KQU1_PERM5|nr:hypothetical protein Pmar_PMAR020778 [Perkinsus marinus ATCC 50983]EER13187.1 hypothetical protein Pmar_PMAR020778 [Perkinsus marinus ATCC 50983]|eukprot:XP_002781392.1 hypothetical protein Pmar_PMAR020778 [Perkinsus marinus ATCC 50983]